MRFTSELRLDDGVLERGFTLGEIPGILWTPGSASAPAPLILLGHPGGLHKMYPRLLARARHSAAEGFAAATIELPWSGDRPRSTAAEEARADLRRALETGEPIDDAIVDRLVVPVVGIAATAGDGYWLTAADGGVFAFGDAQFRGSMADGALAYLVSGIVRSAGDDGYWLTAGDGGVFSFGSARFFGSHGGQGVASRTLWGVDTVDDLSAGMLDAVGTTMGRPEFVGRYLDFGGGLSAAEAGAVHAAGARILVISSPPGTRLLGTATGASEGTAAVGAARAVGVPGGKAVFRNVEQGYTIDAAYIQAWSDAVHAAGYLPGFYENPISGRFPAAYCTAGVHDVVLFSSQPGRLRVPVTKAEAPSYQPDVPSCANTTVAWQYQIRTNFPVGSYPNVDVVVFDGSRTGLLW